jgi:hypothetical protein
MEDEEFIERFEACTLRNDSFHHRDHVRAVWLFLRRYPVLEALVRFSEGLKRFAAAHGKANLYHETITWVYVFLIHERMERDGRDQNWQEFMERNADLFDWTNSILKSYYRDETLRSELARKIFVFPDKDARFAGEGVIEVRKTNDRSVQPNSTSRARTSRNRHAASA